MTPLVCLAVPAAHTLCMLGTAPPPLEFYLHLLSCHKRHLGLGFGSNCLFRVLALPYNATSHSQWLPVLLLAQSWSLGAGVGAPKHHSPAIGQQLVSSYMHTLTRSICCFLVVA